MTLSLRSIVRDRYGITGSFSVKNVLSRARHDFGEGVARTANGSVSLQLLLLVLRVPPPPPIPAKIEYLNAEPNNGYINLGTSATLSWRVTNYQADTKAKLQGRVGAVVFNKANVSLQGSQSVTPGEDTQYTLTVTDSRGQVSQAKWVTVYAPISSPPLLFYFKMTNPQSQITPCFTIAIYAKDKETAKALAEQQNGGYKAESIDASQFMTACG